jgi:hypothetical protein
MIASTEICIILKVHFSKNEKFYFYYNVAMVFWQNKR